MSPRNWGRCWPRISTLTSGEGVEGFSQVGWRIHDDLLQRDHRRGACFPGRIPRDLELPDHLDDTVPGFGGRGRLARQHGPGGALGIIWATQNGNLS